MNNLDKRFTDQGTQAFGETSHKQTDNIPKTNHEDK